MGIHAPAPRLWPTCVPKVAAMRSASKEAAIAAPRTLPANSKRRRKMARTNLVQRTRLSNRLARTASRVAAASVRQAWWSRTSSPVSSPLPARRMHGRWPRKRQRVSWQSALPDQFGASDNDERREEDIFVLAHGVVAQGMDSGVDERRQRLPGGVAVLSPRPSFCPSPASPASAASPPVNMSPSPYSLEPSWLFRRRGRCQAM